MMKNVTINSCLVNAKWLKPEAIDAIRNACMNAAVKTAVEKWGIGQKLTVRDLNGSDMSYTNNIFSETSHASVNAWNAMAFGSFDVANNVILGIYGIGLSVVHDATIDFLPITGIRFDVGGARVAQWNVQPLGVNTSAASTAPTELAVGVTKSPIIVSEDISVTISEYTRTASTLYEPVWLGVTVEKEGKTLKP